MLTLSSQSPGAAGRCSRLKYEARTRLDAFPSIFHMQMRLRGHRELTVKRDTDLVIEGFPRSGNTFACAAFQLAQPYPLKLARHLHAPAQIVIAARWGIPALLLLRRPADAALSLLIRDRTVTLAGALGGYARFYSALSAWREHFVVASFEQVTCDFGSVIARLNRRFGSGFALFEHNAENEAAAFAEVERMELADSGGGPLRQTHVSRPSMEREAMKENLAAALSEPSIAAAHRRAQGVYDDFLALSFRELVGQERG